MEPNNENHSFRVSTFHVLKKVYSVKPKSERNLFSEMATPTASTSTAIQQPIVPLATPTSSRQRGTPAGLPVIGQPEIRQKASV